LFPCNPNLFGIKIRKTQLRIVMNRADKRKGCEDRRVEDIGPPEGWRDRRKRVERRIPETVEIEVSEAEWAAYFERRPDQENTPELANSEGDASRQV
jgi:hypothetical protein